MRNRESSQFRPGFTLLELGIVVLVMGILLTLTVPAFSRVREQTRVDAAAHIFRSIWAAERVYWLENRTFTDSLSTLNTMGLIDPRIAAGSDGQFDYTVTVANGDSLHGDRHPQRRAVWSGTLTITQDGEITGFVSDSVNVLTPPDI